MLFNSYVFLLLFFPVVFLCYRLLVRTCRFEYAKFFLVLASLYFYGFFKPSYLIILILSLAINYFICKKLWEITSAGVRRTLLTLGCALNVGILGYFKYTGFLLENLNLFLGTSFDAFSVLLPLGISFYTFQQLSFLVDTYRGVNQKYSFIDYSLFVTFFPQLIAGPIVLPGEMLPQFNDPARRTICWKNMNEGLFLFACGLVKKCFLADTLTIFADTGFNSGTPLTFAEGWLVALAFTFQLYFDFSGYCDMAMGIGKCFNIDLPLNFNSPYKSPDFQTFWRRWHITLGRFMMNYLYIPLGGNKKGMLRTLLNLLLVFLLSGLWHGAGWLFLLWGGLHGLGILINRLWSKVVLPKYPFLQIPKIPAIVITFLAVNFLWIFFRATSLKRAWEIITSMVDFGNIKWITKPFKIALEEYGWDKDFLFTTMVFAMLLAFCSPNSFEMNEKLQQHSRLRMFLTVLFLTGGFLCVGRNSPFLYFNF